MQSRGYSLVEMVMVVGTISLLVAVATLDFGAYFTRYRTEAQTRLIYDELLRARANALFQRRETRVKLYVNRFEVYSSVADCGQGVAPVVSQPLTIPIVWNQSGNNIDFDQMGKARNLGSVCVGPGGTGTVDSVVVSTIRERVGTKDKGDDCGKDSITVK